MYLLNRRYETLPHYYENIPKENCFSLVILLICTPTVTIVQLYHRASCTSIKQLLKELYKIKKNCMLKHNITSEEIL